MLELLFFLLPIAACSGWYIGYKNSAKNRQIIKSVPKDYVVGLNYLLNEQPDKAVDIFIKMLQVDSDTVETHLALGSLFRRRGEVDRAIRIHQNLIARPQLAKEYRVQALTALGYDYMSAGVFDRAERLFYEVVKIGGDVVPGLQALIDIYQREKNWYKSIEIARQLEHATQESMQYQIAQYYCELAIIAQDAEDTEQVERYIQLALVSDQHCVRACFLQAELALKTGDYAGAIKVYKKAASLNSDFMPEILEPLEYCYRQLGDLNKFIQYLQYCLMDLPQIPVVLALARCLQETQGNTVAAQFITLELQKTPSVRGLHLLIEMQLKEVQKQGTDHQYLTMLYHHTHNLLKDRPSYLCSRCGLKGKILHWHCPSCRSWGTVRPIQGIKKEHT